MPIMIAIPDECKPLPLAEAVTRLVAKTEQVRQRARDEPQDVDHLLHVFLGRREELRVVVRRAEFSRSM